MSIHGYGVGAGCSLSAVAGKIVMPCQGSVRVTVIGMALFLGWLCSRSTASLASCIWCRRPLMVAIIRWRAGQAEGEFIQKSPGARDSGVGGVCWSLAVRATRGGRVAPASSVWVVPGINWDVAVAIMDAEDAARAASAAAPASGYALLLASLAAREAAAAALAAASSSGKRSSPSTKAGGFHLFSHPGRIGGATMSSLQVHLSAFDGSA